MADGRKAIDREIEDEELNPVHGIDVLSKAEIPGINLRTRAAVMKPAWLFPNRI
jgi:hypothetical protein